MSQPKKDGFTLGIDFGTSNTVAMVREPDGTVRQLLFDGSNFLPSTVVQLPDGDFLTGTVALRQRRINEELLVDVRCPKNLIGHELVPDTDVPVTTVVAAVLRRVREEYEAIYGAPDRVIITYPTHWTNPSCNALKVAAREAGFAEVETTPESTAAAAYYAQQDASSDEYDKPLLVYDLGAGTFDVSLIRRTSQGFQQLGRDGNGELGGNRIDSEIVNYVLSDAPDKPMTDAQRHFAQRRLYEDARELKETLSSSDEGTIYNEWTNSFIAFNRDQLEDVARDIVDETISISQDVIRRSGVAPHEVDKVLLVGGATRMPLVHQRIAESLGQPVTVHGQPETVVVNGSLLGLQTHEQPEQSPPAEVGRKASRSWATPRNGFIAAVCVLLLVFALSAGNAILRDSDPYGLPEGDGETITLGIIDWPDSVAVTELWAHALRDSGYDVQVKHYSEVSHIFADLAAGSIDLFFNGWFPITHGEYLNQYRFEFSSLGTWYSEARLIVAIPASLRQINSLQDLNDHANLFDGRLVGIESDAGITQSVVDYTIPEYNLTDFELETSSTAGMLNNLERAMQEGENIAVTMWEPHYALEEHRLKVLDDPEGTLGGDESIEIVSSKEFEEDFPDLAESLSEFTMDEEPHSSLQAEIFMENHRSAPDAVHQWLEHNSFKDFF